MAHIHGQQSRYFYMTLNQISLKFINNNPSLATNSVVSYSNCHFLIANCPTDGSLDVYLREFKRHNVQLIVRVCLPTYDKQRFEKEGIGVHVTIVN